MNLTRTMSLMGNGGGAVVSESLSRASSANLAAALLLLSAETEAIVASNLRRAKSLSFSKAGLARRDASSLKPSEKVWESFGLVGADVEADSVCSDDVCLSETLDMVEEPRRVPKDVLRSLSTSYRWLEVPFQDFAIPPCSDVVEPEHGEDETQLLRPDNDSVESSPVSSSRVKKLAAAANIVNHAYIHDCGTGKSIATHEQLRTAMDRLGSWRAELPHKCSVRYVHEITGDVASLAWPDLEAGGVEEIESFVGAINRVEGWPVFFPRYGRLQTYPIVASRLSKTESAMASVY